VFGELALRFVIGGLVVSGFAVLGEMLTPKRFAGIFGAAPSVALATLGMAFVTQSGEYVSAEGRSMMAGAVAFCLYSLVARRLLVAHGAPALAAASFLWAVWLAVAVALWGVFLR